MPGLRPALGGTLRASLRARAGLVRGECAFVDRDRALDRDIAAVMRMIDDGRVPAAADRPGGGLDATAAVR